ncbi:hypothetical protein pb186bvf_007392 [Paramecium bursaria]
MADSQSIIQFQRYLFQLQDRIIIVYEENTHELEIQHNGKISQQDKRIHQPNKPINIIAIYGMIQLQKLKYLIVITQADLVGSILDRQIFKVKQTQFIPLGPKILDQNYINQLKPLINTLYFSETYDLTNSLQRYFENKGVRQICPQYCMNYELMKEFRLFNPEQWIPIFISGLIAIKYFTLNNKQCQLVLLSRRDTRRMGRRFISRGADLDGNCSNFAETEQIFNYNNIYYSYLQTRGSMPFKWSQKPDLKWSPKCKILSNDQQNLEIIEKHFRDQFTLGIQKQVLVNLIDKKGSQLMLGTYFNKLQQLMKNQDIKYIWFDFHHECRNMKYENLIKLIAQFKQSLDNEIFSFELQESKPKIQIVNIQSQQKEIIRTNCVDCLDRTNVVQSVIARYVLWNIIQRIGVVKQGDAAMLPFPPELEQSFRDIWTLNADTISQFYTGTGALKTDSTKYGKRTIKGNFVDGYRSIKRYFLGNFYDADNQNSIDLITGKIDLKKQSFSSPLNRMYILFLTTILVGYFAYQASIYVTDNQAVRRKIQDIQPNNGIVSKGQLFGVQLITGFVFLLISRSLIMSFNKLFVKQPLLNH